MKAQQPVSKILSSKSKMLKPMVERACHWLLVHRHLGGVLLVLGYLGL